MDDERKPDFYLASIEDASLQRPRACRSLKRLHGTRNNDGLLVAVAPMIVVEIKGRATRELDEVILSPRFEGDTLFPITKFPLPVYVIDIQADGEVEIVTWAEIYADLDSARRSTTPPNLPKAGPASSSLLEVKDIRFLAEQDRPAKRELKE